MTNTFEILDKYLMTDEGLNKLASLDPNEKIGVFGGCTALVVLLTTEDIYVANAGVYF